MTWSASWEPIGAEVYGGDFATYDEALSELIFALRHAGLVWCGWLVDWSFFWRLPGFEKHDIQYDTFFVAGNYWSLETFQFSKIHKKKSKASHIYMDFLFGYHEISNFHPTFIWDLDLGDAIWPGMAGWPWKSLAFCWPEITHFEWNSSWEFFWDQKLPMVKSDGSMVHDGLILTNGD